MRPWEEREAEGEARETLTGGDPAVIKIVGQEPREGVVERITPQRIVVDGRQYLKKTGRAYGLHRNQAVRELWILHGANHRRYLDQKAQAEERQCRNQEIHELVKRFHAVAGEEGADLVELAKVLAALEEGWESDLP